jgi:hypothetical protein
MSEHIKNAGSKGFCLMWGIISILLIVILLVAVYRYNFKFL